MSQKKQISSIIKAYMDSKSEAGTGYKFQQWITSSEERSSKDDALEDVWNECDKEYSSADDNVWSRIQDDVKSPRGRSGRFRTVIISVASTAAILLAGFFVKEKYFPKDIAESPELRTTCYVTANDSKGEFTLPDGSNVWLNENSVLKITDGFTGDTRRVSLEGEGFFDVVHNPDKPFIVDIGKRKIEVLGTAFDVKNYPRLKYQEIVLVRGSINISDDRGDVLLHPDERYTAQTLGEGEDITTVDTADYSHWMDRVLRFDNKPLKNIIVNLEHWYNMEFIVDPAIDQNTRLSFNVKYEPVDEIMRAMSMVSSFRYRIDYENKTVYMSAKRHSF